MIFHCTLSTEDTVELPQYILYYSNSINSGASLYVKLTWTTWSLNFKSCSGRQRCTLEQNALWFDIEDERFIVAIKMKFFQTQKCRIKTTRSHDLRPFIEKMFLRFFAAVLLIWPIDHAYGNGTATSEDCGFVFVNGCPDSVEGGIYFDEVFGDEKEVIIKNQAVIIRQNTTVNRIRVDKCGFLTVQGNGHKILVFSSQASSRLWIPDGLNRFEYSE